MKVLEVVTAEEAGFCFGVQRAMDIVHNALEENKKDDVYTLGPLIHNPQVVANLKKQGIRMVENIDQIPEGILIIRSHGVEPEILERAREKNLEIIDATCPFVKNAQKYAGKLIEEGYETIIFGDHNHPEVKGIYGATERRAKIVASLEELESLELKNKVGFVAQTTQSPSSYKRLVSSVIEKVKEVKAYNTICNTTEVRQSSAIGLARKVDVMLVIGGYNSANTTRLAELCSAAGTKTYHIETADDLKDEWFAGLQKVGITAGASTPDWLIKEVIEVMDEEKQDVEKIEEEAQETAGKKNNVEEEVNDMEEQEKEEVEMEEQDVVAGEEDTEVTAEEIVDVTEDTGEEVAEASGTETVKDEDIEEVEAEEEEDGIEEAAEDTFSYSDNDIADLKKGQTVSGTVIEVNDDGIYVDVNYKTEGFVPIRELSHSSIDHPSDIVSEGDEIDVVILTLEDEEGNMILSKKQADYEKAWEDIIESYENNEIIEAEITKEVKGGLVVDVGVRGFIPASHVAIGYVEDLSQYVGKTCKLKVIEVERDNNNVVLSRREVLEEERAEMKEETLEDLEEGQVVTGEITKLVNFGAFVELGGVEGLLHISEMSWGRIGHPSELFEEGQDIEVKVLGVDREEERISLGYKQLQPDPWEEFAKKHYEGEIVTGTITKIVDFGAFMEIEKGIEGLIHISQLSRRHVKTPDEVVTVGEEREAKIINIDPEQKRVGLSLKELEDAGEQTGGGEKSSSGGNGNSAEEDEEKDSGATIGELVGDIFDEDK
ncbi:MAG: bifunctional 4-hydroxy-3-methylbut-2-enyl diphosphate reductase/30S ribosomal protein S1 [Halanaerobiaceae bacterium]